MKSYIPLIFAIIWIVTYTITGAERHLIVSNIFVAATMICRCIESQNE